jgi:hypothetical protein
MCPWLSMEKHSLVQAMTFALDITGQKLKKVRYRTSPGCPKRATTRADRVREEKPENIGICSVKTRMRYLEFPRMSSEKPEPLGVMLVREAIRWGIVC